MARFNKIHTVEDNDDEETVERMSRIGLKFGTLEAVMMNHDGNDGNVGEDNLEQYILHVIQRFGNKHFTRTITF